MHLLGLRANGDCCMSSYPVLPRKTGALSRSPAGILTEAAYRKQVWTLSWRTRAVIHGGTYHEKHTTCLSRDPWLYIVYT